MRTVALLTSALGCLLAAIQYVLGDLDADATPSAKLGRK